MRVFVYCIVWLINVLFKLWFYRQWSLQTANVYTIMLHNVWMSSNRHETMNNKIPKGKIMYKGLLI